MSHETVDAVITMSHESWPRQCSYTAVMRAALAGGLLERALRVWEECEASRTRPDSRLCVVYMDVCTRLGRTDRALAVYDRLRPGAHDSAVRMRIGMNRERTSVVCVALSLK